MMTIKLKACLTIWWKGLGVLGSYIAYSVVAGLLGGAIAALPEDLLLPVGLPLFVIAAPPLFYACHRMMWPEK